MNINIFSLTHSSSTKSMNTPKLQYKKNKQKSRQINKNSPHQLNIKHFKYEYNFSVSR